MCPDWDDVFGESLHGPVENALHESTLHALGQKVVLLVDECLHHTAIEIEDGSTLPKYSLVNFQVFLLESVEVVQSQLHVSGDVTLEEDGSGYRGNSHQNIYIEFVGLADFYTFVCTAAPAYLRVEVVKSGGFFSHQLNDVTDDLEGSRIIWNAPSHLYLPLR